MIQTKPHLLTIAALWAGATLFSGCSRQQEQPEPLPDRAHPARVQPPADTTAATPDPTPAIASPTNEIDLGAIGDTNTIARIVVVNDRLSIVIAGGSGVATCEYEGSVSEKFFEEQHSLQITSQQELEDTNVTVYGLKIDGDPYVGIIGGDSVAIHPEPGDKKIPAINQTSESSGKKNQSGDRGGDEGGDGQNQDKDRSADDR